LVWPSAAAAIKLVVGSTDELADQTKAAPVTAVGAAVAVMFTPVFGATGVAWTCADAAVQVPGAIVAPQVVPVATADQALMLAAVPVACTSTSIAVAPVRLAIA